MFVAPLGRRGQQRLQPPSGGVCEAPPRVSSGASECAPAEVGEVERTRRVRGGRSIAIAARGTRKRGGPRHSGRGVCVSDTSGGAVVRAGQAAARDRARPLEARATALRLFLVVVYICGSRVEDTLEVDAILRPP